MHDKYGIDGLTILIFNWFANSCINEDLTQEAMFHPKI